MCLDDLGIKKHFQCSCRDSRAVRGGSLQTHFRNMSFAGYINVQLFLDLACCHGYVAKLHCTLKCKLTRSIHNWHRSDFYHRKYQDQLKLMADIECLFCSVFFFFEKKHKLSRTKNYELQFYAVAKFLI